VPVGRVGRAHGRDGSFYVDGPSHPLQEGTPVMVRGHERRVERRAGTDARPLIRLSGVGVREDAAELRGEALLVAASEAPLDEGEWLAEDLVGCEVPGVGRVLRVLSGPSCDLLEVGLDEVLIPFVSDAVRRVDTEARVIEADLAFLGLDPPPDRPASSPEPPASPSEPPDSSPEPPASSSEPPASPPEPPASP
jgi:16S rRNA processing protein RimM